jgi:serine/threonine-protein kinase
MSPELSQKVRQIYEEALELPRAKRARFLEFACADSPEVKREVERMLAAQGEIDGVTLPNIPAPPHPATPPEPSPVMPGPLRPGPTAPGKDGGVRLQKINRYVIKGELGKGAMGAVYEAVDPVIGRTVALKVLHSNTVDEEEAKALEDRLFREASSAGRLAHPGIVTVYDVGKEGELAFIAMERVDGPTLQQMINQRKVDRQQTLEILRQAAAALDYAHAEGIIHRDIKPANIMLHKGTQTKIADFGIAKVSAMSQLTVAGTILGTPSYMSPEQIQNFSLSGRSDQFSLAVVGYEMLTGKKPFERETMPALLLAIVNGERPLASAADRTLPSAVDEVFQMALNKSADQRFASCCAFVTALASALGIELAAQTGSGTGSHAAITGGFAPIGPAGSGATGPRTAPPPPPPPPPPPTLTGGSPSFANTVVQMSPNPLTPPPAQSAQKGTPPWVYALAGLLVVLLAAAYPVYKYVYPGPGEGKKQVEQPKTGESKTPPAETKLEIPPTSTGEPAKEEKPSEPSKEPAKAPGSESPKHEERNSGNPEPAKPPSGGPEHTAPTRSAPSGVDTARAQQLYEEGLAKHKGQPGSAAIPSFEQAAAMGEARAMLELGRIYSAGDGVAKDPVKAASWYRRAADAGNASAMVFLAALYAQGSGVPKDLAEAAKWLRKAADAGNAVAMDGLGQMYTNGQGVPADPAQAVVWYRKAIENNNALAMYHLGLLLESGAGTVARNPAEAAQLFQRAANAGYAPAKAKLAGGSPLTLTGINPGSVSENKSQLYRLTGSGFSANTTVRSDVNSFIGSRSGQADYRPVAVAPDGSWLAIYISLPPQQGRNTVRLSAKNPSGPEATIDVPIQR